MSEIKLLDGASRKPSGQISVIRESAGMVRMKITNGRVTFDVMLPATIARSLGELLATAAGPERPALEVVEGGKP